jgi:hypothetical protein
MWAATAGSQGPPVEHPLVYRDDQSGLLGKRDKIARRHEATFGVLPADERLETSAKHPAFSGADREYVLDRPERLRRIDL